MPLSLSQLPRTPLLPDPFFGDLERGAHGCFADDDAVEDDGHVALHGIDECRLACPWKGTVCCLQVVLTEEALAEHRVSLGVLCGLREFYHPHALPPCVVDHTIDWSMSATRTGAETHAA